MPPKYLSTKEAANYLNSAPQTLANWRVKGRGPAFKKFGRRVVYSPTDLARWADENTRNHTQEDQR